MHYRDCELTTVLERCTGPGEGTWRCEIDAGDNTPIVRTQPFIYRGDALDAGKEFIDRVKVKVRA